jgi:hypothetical protein
VGYLGTPTRIQSQKELLDGILQHDFAVTLKKIRVATLTRKTNAVSDEDDGLSQYVHPNVNKFVDIGDVMNYKYWFRWAEPEPTDWLNGHLPLNKVDPVIIKQFEDTLYDLLPDTLAEVDRREVLLSVSSSSCLDPNHRKVSKVFKDKQDPKKNVFSKAPLYGLRTLVYKGPTETRDCVTLSLDQSNTIKWIERQCAIISSKMKYSAYGKTKVAFDKELHSFYKSDHQYYNRDLAKEGITKPRWILLAIGNACKRKYPHMEIWDYFSIYSQFTVMTRQGTEHYMERGHGLGMANALTTIMQCVVFQMILDDHDEIYGNPSALFYNDDGTIRFEQHRDDDPVLNYSEIESDYLSMLGLIKKTAKTYSASYMVLCERYFPAPLGLKLSYSRYIRRLPFAAPCITVAKNLFYLFDDLSFGAFEPHLAALCIGFFGCEYTSEELNLPWWAGGWHRPQYKGVDLSFLTRWELNKTFFRGFRVGVPYAKPKKFHKEVGTWVHPVTYVHNIDLHGLDKRIEPMLMLNQPLGEVAATFSRGSSDSASYAFLKAQLFERYNQWCSPAKEYTLCEMYAQVVDKNPWLDIIPPEGSRVLKPLDSLSEPAEWDLPPKINQPNKLLAAISYYTGQQYIPKTIPYPYIQGEDQYTNLTGERMDRYRESIYNLPGVSVINTEDCYELTGTMLKKRHYINDYNVISAYATATGDTENVPIPLQLSVGGQIKHEASTLLYHTEKYGAPDLWDFWVTYGRTIPVLLMYYLSVDMWSNILKELGIIPEEAQDEIFQNATTPLDDQEETVDFWTWWANKDLKIPSYYRKIFETAGTAVDRFILWKGISAQSNSRQLNPLAGSMTPKEGSGMDILCKRICKVDTANIDNVYVYQQPDMLSAWADDGSEGGLADFFEDPG